MDNLNDKYEVFEKHIANALNKHALIKPLSKKERKASVKPWITSGIRKSIVIKNEYFQKYKETKNQFFFIRYKIYRDRLNHLIRTSKRTYLHKYFEENKNNIRKTWSKINCILNRKRKTHSTICLLTEKSFISDQYEVGNKFNTYFTTVAAKLVDKLKVTNKKHSDNLTNPNISNFFINPTDSMEIEIVIKSLSNSKSSDIYGFPAKYWKMIAPKISSLLSMLFNESFNNV